jgi:hypothetical protein
MLTRSGHRNELNIRVFEIRVRGVDRNDLLDARPRAFGRNDLHRRIAIFPDLGIEPMLVAWHHQERGTTEFLELPHLVVVERDRTEYDEPRIAQPNHGHAPGQIHERHVDLADDRQNVSRRSA